MQQLSFLQELIARWKAKQPKLFKAITNISALLVFLTGLPQVIEYLAPGIELPEALTGFIAKVVFYASLVGGVISKLVVDTPKTTETVLKQIDSGSKPETAKIGA